MIQAEDRAHRIGQDAGCVNIHYLVGADTLDVLLFRKLNEKQNIVSTTLDNKSKDLNVTKIKEQVGDFINMNGKKVSIDSRKNISQIVDKSNINIMNYISSKSNQELSVKSQIRTNNTFDVNDDKNIITNKIMGIKVDYPCPDTNSFSPLFSNEAINKKKKCLSNEKSLIKE